MPLSRDEKEQLKAQHGDLVYANYPEGEFLFRTPTEVAYGRFISAASNDKRGHDRTVAFRQLCVECLVHPEAAPGQPDHARLLALFSRLPGLPLTIGADLVDLAGGGDSAAVGKL